MKIEIDLPEVTIIEEDGQKYGYMYWNGLEVKELIEPEVFEMTESKQKYWFKRTLVILQRRMKELRRKHPKGILLDEVSA